MEVADLERTGTLADGDGMPATATPTLDHYRFPAQKLRRKLRDPSKKPLVLISCGSFSPITFLHLRMFEMASDWIKFNTDYELIGGFLSPVGDAYKKAGLAAAHHRIAMCTQSVEGSQWAVDTWEPLHKEYLPTALVLDHFEHELNEVLGGVETESGERKKIQICLLAGADLIQTMSTPGVWAEKDIAYILGKYGAFIIERAGTETDEALQSLQQWRDNIHVIPQLIQNDVSSTKIRLFLRRDMSIRYLIPQPAIDYIFEHGLYRDDGQSSTHEQDKAGSKGKAAEGASDSQNS